MKVTLRTFITIFTIHALLVISDAIPADEKEKVGVLPIFSSGIITEDTEALNAPDSDDEPVALLQEGQRVLIQKTTDDFDWCKIRIGKKTMWVDTDHVDFYNKFRTVEEIEDKIEGKENPFYNWRYLGDDPFLAMNEYYRHPYRFGIIGGMVHGLKGYEGSYFTTGIESNNAYYHFDLSYFVVYSEAGQSGGSKPHALDLHFGGKYDVYLSPYLTTGFYFTIHNILVLRPSSQVSFGASFSIRFYFNIRQRLYVLLSPQGDLDFFHMAGSVKSFDLLARLQAVAGVGYRF